MRLATKLLLAWLACVASIAVIVVLRPLWFDEILGLSVSTLEWPREVMAATAAGVDLKGPVWYGIAGLVVEWTGSDLGSRWIAWLGFCAALGLTWRFATMRFGPLAGAIAPAVLLLTKAPRFAAEGCPYGLLLGLAAGAFVAWWRATRPGASPAWALLMAVLLATGLTLHYFAALVWIPIACGEIARFVRDRRVVPVVLAGLALALAPLVVLLPHAREAKAMLQHAPFSPPAVEFLGKHYLYLLDVAIAPLVLLALHAALSAHPGAIAAFARRIVRDPESAFLAALLLLPVFGMAVAVVGGSGVSHPRYALPFTLGVALATAAAARSLKWSDVRLARVMGFLVVAAVVAGGVNVVRAWSKRSAVEEAAPRGWPLDLPIAYGSSFDGLQQWHYADAKTRQRLFLPAEVDLAVRHGESATGYVSLLSARRFGLYPVASWAEMRAEKPRFVLVQRAHADNWIAIESRAQGGRLEPLSAPPGWEAWLVDLHGDG